VSLVAKLAEVHERVAFDEPSHSYAIDGNSMVPVTSVVKQLDKPFLIRAAVALTRQGKDYEQEWGEKRGDGIRVHRAMQNWALRRHGVLTMPEPHTPESAYLAAGLIEWLEKAATSGELELPFLPERRTFHPEHGYAGTKDLPCLWLGQPTILDLKTCPDGSSSYTEWPLQVSAYAAAAEYHTGVEWVGGILRCPRDGSGPSILPYGVDRAAFQAFLGLLAVYRWVNRVKTPNRKRDVEKAVNKYLERSV